MRQALVLALLLLVVAACENNYDPPQGYGIKPGYGSNGRAYAAQQSPSEFTNVDVQVEEDVPTRTSSDVAPGLDGSSEVSSPAVLLCIADNGGDAAFKDYCDCVGDDKRMSSVVENCTCEFLVCLAEPPDPEQEADVEFCLAWGFTGGPCSE